MTTEGRDRSPERNLGPAALSTQVIPEGMPGSAGTAGASPKLKLIPRATRGLPRPLVASLWDVYACSRGQKKKILSIYNISVRGGE
jgi:hypothetical protein